MRMIDSHGWKINHLFQMSYHELFNNKGSAKFLFSML